MTPVDSSGPIVQARHRPILVDVNYGNSAILENRIDAVKYGHQESDYRAEFYYLDLSDGPKWVPITEDSGEADRGILGILDDAVADGELTEGEARWARDQFE